MLIVGEVHTVLLRGSDPVDVAVARNLVDLISGEHVLVSERPMAYVRSPGRPVGVDCPLAGAGPARQVRGIGTAIQRSTITGGHILQGSVHTTVVRGEHSTRQPWSHYLARPGVIETTGRARWPDLADSLATPPGVSPLPGDSPVVGASPVVGVSPVAGAELDLGAVAERAADEVQRRAADQARRRPYPEAGRAGTVRLRAARTRLRWVAQIDPAASGPPRVAFGVQSEGLRLLRITVQAADADDLATVGEDLARHDWLLTTLIEAIRKAAVGVLPRAEAIDRLVPAIDYLLHLWMPRARPSEVTDRVWQVLEHTPGFTRQWETLVHRIRDQLSVAAVAALSAAKPR